MDDFWKHYKRYTIFYNDDYNKYYDYLNEEKLNYIIKLYCDYGCDCDCDHDYDCDCSCNYLTILPDLPNCVELDCYSNQLTYLPNLPNCVELDCSDNQLTILPDLPKCKKLDCDDNKLLYSNINSYKKYKIYKA